jgi:hypothetical protein
MADLAACPFCGEPATIRNVGMNGGANVIVCNNKDCRVRPHTDPLSHAEALRAWNTRPAPPEAPQPCAHCGAEAGPTWDLRPCALDDEREVPLCRECDIELNAMILNFVRAPDAAELMDAYRAQGMAAPSGGETGTGSTEGNSPVREADAPLSNPDSTHV